MTQLFRRAHQHGISALFTRREYAAGRGGHFIPGPAGSALVQGGNGGFQRIIGNDANTCAAKDEPQLNTNNQSGFYSVSASAQQSEEREVIALGQVHLRQDIDVREDERWGTG